jgi:citrate synthase
MTTRDKVDSGLEGVVVAESALSRVDGEAGRLIVAGHEIADLVERASFEQVCALLWEGAAPSAASESAYRARLGEARVRAFAELPRLAHALAMTDPMDALRAALALLPPLQGDGLAQATQVTAATAVFAAARARGGASHALAPDPELDHARDYLRMLGGREDERAARALGRYLVTLCDHDLNASTFAARVVTSTGPDLLSAIVAAVGALTGPLHGGAPGPVLDMLDAVAAHGDARSWLQEELAAGRRIMGMGHRVYRVRDPRAAVREAATRLLDESAQPTPRLDAAREVERAARALLRARSPGRSLDVNVEFYTAVLLDALGLERGDFTPTFATARVAGWCAHVLEHRRGGRLVRPALRYVGPSPELAA